MSSNKTVLFLITLPGFSYSYENSAVAKYLFQLALGLKNEGFQVLLVPDDLSGASISGAHVASQGFSHKVKGLLRKYFPYLYNTIVDFKFFRNMRPIEKEADSAASKADVIVQFLTYGSDTGVSLKEKYQKPLLIIYDSPLDEQYKEMYSAGSAYMTRIRKAEKRSVLGADSILCYSDSVRKHIGSQYGRSENVNVMPCIVWKGISPDSAIGKKYIGFIGSFLKWHKVENLVAAFGMIASEFPGVDLLLLGYGVEWNRINNLVQMSSENSRIHMPGFVTEKELTDFKKNMIVGVMPGTNWYGSPLKLFEYAESGIPMIAPSSPSVKDLFISGEEVLLIDPSDEVESLANHLRILCSDNEFRMKLAGNAKRKMEGEFGKAHQTAIFTELISNLLERGIKK